MQNLEDNNFMTKFTKRMSRNYDHRNMTENSGLQRGSVVKSSLTAVPEK